MLSSCASGPGTGTGEDPLWARAHDAPTNQVRDRKPRTRLWTKSELFVALEEITSGLASGELLIRLQRSPGKQGGPSVDGSHQVGTSRHYKLPDSVHP